MSFGSALCEDERAPFELSVTTATLSAILLIVTVPGNILICWAIVKDPNKELRSPFNYLVLNLAIADLITGVITEPSFVVFHVRESLKFEVMNRVEIIHVPYFITCTASLLSIAALATERYLTVTSTYRRTYSQSRAVWTSVGIWMFSIVASFIYFATGFYTFVFVFANTTVIATLVIITFACIRIYQSLHAHIEHGETTRSDRMIEQRLNYERKATRSFVFVLFIFICCNVSSCVMIYVILFCDVCTCDVIHWLRDFQFLMALVNCSANQFLYAWRMPTFIRAFKVLLTVKGARVGSGRLSSVTERTHSGTESVSVQHKVKSSSV